MGRFIFSLIFLVFTSGVVHGATLTDVNPDDAMTISGIPGYDPLFIQTTISESIAENNTVPYTYGAFDGFAITNDAGGYFDIHVVPQEIEEIGSRNFILKFDIQNQGIYSWSGFHFEFYTLDFDSDLDVQIIIGETPDFDQTQFFGLYNQLHFWSEETFVDSGGSASFSIWIDFSTMPELSGGFGIRQFATAVPIPGAVWLMGAGIVCLWGLRKKGRSCAV